MSECPKCHGNHFISHPDGAIKPCDCTKTPVFDPVNRPAHYSKGGVECIDAVTAAVSDLSGFEAHATASAIQYLWRWRQKGGAQDLRKARWFIDRLIEEVD